MNGGSKAERGRGLRVLSVVSTLTVPGCRACSLRFAVAYDRAAIAAARRLAQRLTPLATDFQS